MTDQKQLVRFVISQRSELRAQLAAAAELHEPRSEQAPSRVRPVVGDLANRAVNASGDVSVIPEPNGAEKVEPLQDPVSVALHYGRRMGEIKREEAAFKQRYGGVAPAADSPDFAAYVADMDALARFCSKTMTEVMKANQEAEAGDGADPFGGEDPSHSAIWLAAVLGTSIGLEENGWQPLVPVLRRLTDQVLAEIAAVLGEGAAGRIRDVNGMSFLHSFNIGLGASVSPPQEASPSGH